jgi:hypothetical protein
LIARKNSANDLKTTAKKTVAPSHHEGTALVINWGKQLVSLVHAAIIPQTTRICFKKLKRPDVSGATMSQKITQSILLDNIANGRAARRTMRERLKQWLLIQKAFSHMGY